MKRPEILSPAGNFEKMKFAILYGADAVYLAGIQFGMRTASDNFTREELIAFEERNGYTDEALEEATKVFVEKNNGDISKLIELGK